MNNIKKVLILDSGTLINLSMNGLLYILEELKKTTQVRLAITKAVRYETIDRPAGIPRFELGALEINNLLKSNILELPQSFSISEKQLNTYTKTLLEKANHALQSNDAAITIVSTAEMSCLALSSLLEKEGFETLVAIDERTTRTLCEKPENLEQIMSSKLHLEITLNKKNLAEFKNYRFIRSTELVYVAYKKGLLRIKDPKALEAALYATKFKGAAVSFEEINILKSL